MGHLALLMIYFMRMNGKSACKGCCVLNIRNSIMAFGLGAAAYHYVRKNNVMSVQNMKKAKKLVKSYF